LGFVAAERQALSAIALHADTSSMTAIGNDYGYEEVFARQVRAHGRPGDVLIALSTSGRSENVVRAARAARECGLETLALTGPGASPLGDVCDDVLRLGGASTATTQELHLVAIHILCGAVDRELALRAASEAGAAAADARQPARRRSTRFVRERRGALR
jgi:phosphoheptose isomerase